MEDSEIELLRELERLSKSSDADMASLERLSAQLERLNAGEPSGESASRLIEIGGLLASASDVTGIGKGQATSSGGSVLTIHLSGIGSRSVEFRNELESEMAIRRLLRELGGEVAKPLSAASEETEGEWIDLGALIVRTSAVLGVESAFRKTEKGDTHLLAAHLSGMDLWKRSYASEKERDGFKGKLARCVWGPKCESQLVKPKPRI